MADDLAGAHAARIHRNDLVVEPRKPPLVLGDQLRIETRPTVPRHRQLDLASVGDDGLLAIPISPVARLLAGEVVIHRGVENPFGQRLLQIVEQTVGVEGRLGSAPASRWSRTASGIRGSLRRGIGGLLCSHHAHPARNSRQSRLPEEFRISISKQTLSRELCALGLRKLSARPRHHAQDAEALAAFKKTSPRASTRSPSATRQTSR